MDKFYIKQTLKLAKKGYGSVSPNPMVGCVIVKDGVVIGHGYHETFGGPHAEVNAINSVQDKNLLVGSIMYINLQPCSHVGKTPACTDLIISSGITRVVFGSFDTNTKVSSERLVDAGIEVIDGVLKNQADYFNRKFLHWKNANRPYITLKVGSTLDGKMADKNQYSKWITSKAARDYVYKLRAGYDAILVGGNTVRADNPNLGLHGGLARREPLRILISSKTVPNDSDFFRDSNYVVLPSFEAFWDYCSVNEISSVLVEGGSEIYKYFIESRSFNELLVFYGPKLLGSDHLNWASNKDIGSLDESLCLNLVGCKRFDDTICGRYLHK
jgi:diaminohydroxyphosphoribosylaminopyrimidine deaminase/5-amino-6-(5-phosphoribosylamino)uracil reductase